MVNLSSVPSAPPSSISISVFGKSLLWLVLLEDVVRGGYWMFTSSWKFVCWWHNQSWWLLKYALYLWQQWLSGFFQNISLNPACCLPECLTLIPVQKLHPFVSACLKQTSKQKSILIMSSSVMLQGWNFVPNSSICIPTYSLTTAIC